MPVQVAGRVESLQFKTKRKLMPPKTNVEVLSPFEEGLGVVLSFYFVECDTNRVRSILLFRYVFQFLKVLLCYSIRRIDPIGPFFTLLMAASHLASPKKASS